ncbi:MAG: T9SS type A sorting domain-containing protein [Bacteroidetes bacterium]|nr:T9SS type A sorting domain-containing protein [Bacteroidota bacterium]
MSFLKNILLPVLLPALIGTARGQDIPINPNLTWNGEISLAANPQNPGQLVAAWMKLTALNTVSIAICNSSDNGNNWSVPVYMQHFQSSYTSADPALICSANGVFYFAYIDYNNITLLSGGVYVTKSTDNGASWSIPVLAIDASAAPDIAIDRPWLAIDNSSGSFSGNLYLVTKSIKEATAPHHLYLVKSTDGGTTWNTPRLLDDLLPVGPTSNAMGVPCVSANGTLFVNYLSYDPSLSIFPRDVCIRSSDGGLTFSPGIISEIPPASVIPTADSLFQYSYTVSANPADSSNLIHIFTDRRNGDWDIWYNTSFDGGVSWSACTRLNDDPVGNGIGQDMCWGGFSSSGNYAAIWRDRRDAGTGPDADYRIYGSYSTDKGQTFKSNFALGNSSGGLFIPVTGNDFLGACIEDSTIYGAWADKRTPQNQEYFNRHYIPAASGISNPEIKQQQLIPAIIQTAYVIVNTGIIPGNQEFQLNVYDMLGNIKIKQSNSNRLEIGSLPGGMYILGFISDKKRIYQRFIIE